MTPAIAFKGVTRRFGKKVAVKDLSFEVSQGSIYALLGPNGSGKTTTIKMLANIFRPTAGEIYVLGKRSVELGPADYKRIGYVSENQEIPDWMAAGEYFDYLRPFYTRWDQGYCKELVCALDVPVKEPIRKLSRGMRGKVALISAIAFRPELLILDEPFSGLDPLVRDEVVDSIVKVAVVGQEWTVLVSSHDIDEVERFATHVGILNEGELKVNGVKAELLAQYAGKSLKQIYLEQAKEFREEARLKKEKMEVKGESSSASY